MRQLCNTKSGVFTGKQSSVDKTPPNSQPDLEPWIRIPGRGKVVIGKSKSALLCHLHGVEIFGSQECLESPYAHMNKGGNIRRIGNGDAVLVKKLSEYGRVIICLVRGVVSQLETC